TLVVKNLNSLPNEKNCIVLDLLKPGNGKTDEYSVNVETDKIIIGAATDTSIFYGVQSLLQLLPAEKDSTNELEIPELMIKDYHHIKYRGLQLNLCRHLVGLNEIKKYIDFLAYHKFNYFHWHLTEDQGWRIEIKKYPNLTTTGAWRNGTIIGRYPGTGNDNTPHGGFYTQKEVKEIVKYAADRFITVVP